MLHLIGPAHADLVKMGVLRANEIFFNFGDIGQLWAAGIRKGLPHYCVYSIALQHKMDKSPKDVNKKYSTKIKYN